MLKIKCIDREELIKLLTDSKGIVPDHYALISITDPDKRTIIGDEGKKNVLSIKFRADLYGPDLLSLDQGIRIFKFLKETVTEIMKKYDESVLVIQSEEGVGRSGAVAAFAVEYLKPYELIDVDYYLEKNLMAKPNKLALEKLYAVQMLLENFDDQYEKLPYLAYRIVDDPCSDADLTKTCKDYLDNLFRVEIKKLKATHEYLRMLNA